MERKEGATSARPSNPSINRPPIEYRQRFAAEPRTQGEFGSPPVTGHRVDRAMFRCGQIGRTPPKELTPHAPPLEFAIDWQGLVALWQP